jgi:hypothetical protein
MHRNIVVAIYLLVDGALACWLVLAGLQLAPYRANAGNLHVGVEAVFPVALCVLSFLLGAFYVTFSSAVGRSRTLCIALKCIGVPVLCLAQIPGPFAATFLARTDLRFATVLYVMLSTDFLNIVGPRVFSALKQKYPNDFQDLLGTGPYLSRRASIDGLMLLAVAVLLLA